MKVLILNGNPKEGYAEFDSYLNIFSDTLEIKNNQAKVIMLRSMELHDCIGCYSCWLKTPGICCFKDGMEDILKEFLSADIVVLASPIIMSFVSSLLKRVNDRLLPLGHPFLMLNEDRMVHVPRYSHYPKIALLLDSPEESSDTSSELIKKVYENSSRGLKAVWNTKQNVEDIINEIVNF